MTRSPDRRLTGRGVVFGVLAAALVVFAGGCMDPPAEDARSIRMGRSGETTYVSISEPSNVGVNAECTRYCDRLADCWYAVSTASVALTHDEVRDRCRAEQDDCRTKTKATYCCGKFADCTEFSECHARSGEDVANCAGFR